MINNKWLIETVLAIGSAVCFTIAAELAKDQWYISIPLSLLGFVIMDEYAKFKYEK